MLWQELSFFLATLVKPGLLLLDEGMSCKIKIRLFLPYTKVTLPQKYYKMLKMLLGSFNGFGVGGVLAPYLASDVVLFMIKLSFRKNRCIFRTSAPSHHYEKLFLALVGDKKNLDESKL